LDRDSKYHPFLNCLTLTNDDFANSLHCDKIILLLHLGFGGHLQNLSLQRSSQFTLSPLGLDHDKIDGGGFL